MNTFQVMEREAQCGRSPASGGESVSKGTITRFAFKGKKGNTFGSCGNERSGNSARGEVGRPSVVRGSVCTGVQQGREKHRLGALRGEVSRSYLWSD